MKRTAAGLVLLIAFACCSGALRATPKTVQYVRPGGGSSELFAFNAHQSATGEVTGSIVSRSTAGYATPYVVEGRVICVRVVGNRASIGGELVRLTAEDISGAPSYRGWVFYAEDNRDRPGMHDRISEHIYVSDAPVTDCPIPGPDSATEDVFDGDVIVSTDE